MNRNKTGCRPLLLAAVIAFTTCTAGALLPEQALADNKKPDVRVTSLKEREAAVELTRLLDGIQTLSAQFKQQTLDKSGRRIQESEGRTTLKRPNLFRWQVTEPFPQIVVSDGHRISYYDKDLEQVTIQDISKETAATPALLLSGDSAQVLGDFQVRVAKNGTDLFFTLKPTAKDNAFEGLSMSFTGKNLKEMVLTDALGSRTRIDFNDVKLNQKVSDKLFELYVPPGTDVIDQSSAGQKKPGTAKQ